MAYLEDQVNLKSRLRMGGISIRLIGGKRVFTKSPSKYMKVMHTYL